MGEMADWAMENAMAPEGDGPQDTHAQGFADGLEAAAKMLREMADEWLESTGSRQDNAVIALTQAAHRLEG